MCNMCSVCPLCVLCVAVRVVRVWYGGVVLYRAIPPQGDTLPWSRLTGPPRSHGLLHRAAQAPGPPGDHEPGDWPPGPEGQTDGLGPCSSPLREERNGRSPWKPAGWCPLAPLPGPRAVPAACGSLEGQGRTNVLRAPDTSDGSSVSSADTCFSAAPQAHRAAGSPGGNTPPCQEPHWHPSCHPGPTTCSDRL